MMTTSETFFFGELLEFLSWAVIASILILIQVSMTESIFFLVFEEEESIFKSFESSALCQ